MIRNATCDQKAAARKACDYYFRDEGDEYQESDEYEMKRRTENTAEMRRFQNDHNIRLTQEQENKFQKWICDGFAFSLDFNIHTDDVIPIDEDYGFCYLDYLLTENRKFKEEVEEYRIRCLLNSLYDDADRCIRLIKRLQFIEMNKFLMERSHTYSSEEIKGCRSWIHDGHGFWSNPFGVRNANGNEANYLEALHGLNKN